MKWREKGELSMVTYLCNTYSGPWANWKLYSAPAGIPVHNNALEGINGAFKKNGTGRERVNLGSFNVMVSEWLYTESLNLGPLPTEPHVPPSTWREAQLLETGSNSRVDLTIKASVVLRQANLSFAELRDAYIMPSFALIQKLTAPTAVAKRKQLLQLAVKFVRLLCHPSTFQSFSLLINTWKKFYVLIPKDVCDIIHYHCSCPMWRRTMQCSHSLALGIRNKGVVIPIDRSLEALGRKKRGKGGRYAKAKGGLHRQDDEEDAGTGFACSQADDPCCYICGGRKSVARNRIFFCDECDLGYHQKCLVPALQMVPDGSWFCSEECTAMSMRVQE